MIVFVLRDGHRKAHVHNCGRTTIDWRRQKILPAHHSRVYGSSNILNSNIVSDKSSTGRVYGT